MVGCFGLECPEARFRFLVDAELFPVACNEADDSVFGMEMSGYFQLAGKCNGESRYQMSVDIGERRSG